MIVKTAMMARTAHLAWSTLPNIRWIIGAVLLLPGAPHPRAAAAATAAPV